MTTMPLAFYMDVHVPSAVTLGLRRRGLDILTSPEDETRTLDDDALLARATELGRALLSQDADLLRIAQERQAAGFPFSGVIFADQQGVSIGQQTNLVVAITSPTARSEGRRAWIPVGGHRAVRHGGQCLRRADRSSSGRGLCE